eukprot:491645-Prymnesium_polylepis.1
MWGNDITPSLINIKEVIASRYAFSALTHDGKVVSWGRHDRAPACYGCLHDWPMGCSDPSAASNGAYENQGDCSGISEQLQSGIV